MRCRVAGVGQTTGPKSMWVASKASKHPASTPRVCSNARRARCRTRQHTAAGIGLKRSHTHARSRRCSDLRPQAISSAAAVAGAGVAVAAAAAAALQNRRPSGGAHRLSVVAPSGAGAASQQTPSESSPAQPPAAANGHAANGAGPAAAAGAAAPPDASAAPAEPGAEGDTQAGDAAAAAGAARKQVVVTTVSSIFEFSAEEWDACATSSGDVSPFLLHAFFAALEASGSAAPATGWVPCHIALREEAAPGAPAASGRLRAVVPAYIKSHSYGEYVFDHSWANLHHQLGQEYYPKLQCAVPFTPAPGARMLVAPGEDAESLRRTMLAALPQIGDALKARLLCPR